MAAKAFFALSLLLPMIFHLVVEAASCSFYPELECKGDTQKVMARTLPVRGVGPGKTFSCDVAVRACITAGVSECSGCTVHPAGGCHTVESSVTCYLAV